MKKVLVLLFIIGIIFMGCSKEINNNNANEKEVIQIGEYEKSRETNFLEEKNQIIKDFKEKQDNPENSYLERNNKLIELENRDKKNEKLINNFEPKSWVYQLQNNSFKELKEFETDLIVIDIDEASFSRSQVNELKQKKYIISYLSIGEAENYRNYWQENWALGNPRFLDEENPDWEGNFKVKYWDEEWQAIIIKQLDKIIDNDYDGVYLDVVDAYWYYQEKGRETAKEEMIDFVIKLSNYAKTKNQNFKIIPQNALDLVEEQKYLDSIDAIGKEDTWYIDNDKVDEKETTYYLQFLRKVKNENKPVLVIDYPTKQNLKKDFIEKAKNEGFVPFTSNRELDKVK